jgi:hypothetical protein
VSQPHLSRQQFEAHTYRVMTRRGIESEHISFGGRYFIHLQSKYDGKSVTGLAASVRKIVTCIEEVPVHPE